jgi:hypothetical protein
LNLLKSVKKRTLYSRIFLNRTIYKIISYFLLFFVVFSGPFLDAIIGLGVYSIFMFTYVHIS